MIDLDLGGVGVDCWPSLPLGQTSVDNSCGEFECVALLSSKSVPLGMPGLTEPQPSRPVEAGPPLLMTLGVGGVAVAVRTP